MRRYIANLVLLPLPLLLAACGEGGSGTGTGTGVTVVSPSPSPTPAPTPTPTPAPTPAPSPTPTPTPTATTWAGKAAALYDVQPDVASCTSGTLKAAVKADFLAKLNAIRALHNLPPVTYSSTEDSEEADSSLMMAIAKALSHTPPTSWTCYSSSGASGAGKSNLVGSWSTGGGGSFDSEDDYLALWLTEGGSASVGHRRWILNPFLGKTSYGRVAVTLADGTRASAASMRVFGFAGGVSVPAGIPAYVAYPFGDYPVRYFGLDDYLSFTAVPNTTAIGGNGGVGFSGATITVTGPGGTLPVTDVTSDTSGYGVPNNVQWRVTGLQSGVTYTVRIAGVTGTAQSDYTYTFRVI